MEIKSVALLGAGAVGSYIIWGLSKLPDIRFGIIAEGSRAARLRDEGCRINNVTYHPLVWSPQEAKGVDLLIVALKYGALPGGLRQIVADVQAELAPDFFINAIRVADMDIGAAHKRFNRQHTLTFKRCLCFAENNTDSFFRVEAHAVALVTRRNLDQCRQNLLAVDNAGNNLLAVHAVHQAHNSGIRANCLADACQCAG